jgi:hypothetical protein
LATIVAFVLAGIFGASDYERVYFLALPFVLMIFLPVFEEGRPSAWQITVAVLAQISLLDVFARPDFMTLPRWFMTNTQWLAIAEYSSKVVLWTVGPPGRQIRSLAQGQRGSSARGRDTKPLAAVPALLRGRRHRISPRHSALGSRARPRQRRRPHLHSAAE